MGLRQFNMVYDNTCESSLDLIILCVVAFYAVVTKKNIPHIPARMSPQNVFGMV